MGTFKGHSSHAILPCDCCLYYICMEFFLFCERNVLRTRNGGIEGSLFCLRNVLMETSVKKIFRLPGMVESRD